MATRGAQLSRPQAVAPDGPDARCAQTRAPRVSRAAGAPPDSEAVPGPRESPEESIRHELPITSVVASVATRTEKPGASCAGFPHRGYRAHAQNRHRDRRSAPGAPSRSALTKRGLEREDALLSDGVRRVTPPVAFPLPVGTHFR